jgi:hypothetical protein
VCSVCGAWEGSLTTDCPGAGVAERRKEVYETNLDFTDERGWYLGVDRHREPRFEKPAAEPYPAAPARHLPLLVILAKEAGTTPRTAGCVCGWRTPRDAHDSDTAYAEHVAIAMLAPDVDWERVEHAIALRDELMQKAVAWATADRFCDDCSAALGRIEDEIAVSGEATPVLREKLEDADIEFKLSVQRAERCDDEFRQAARKLVAELEKVPGSIANAFVYSLKEGPEAALEFVAKLKEP